MSARLPLYIDPWRLVQQGGRLQGRLPLAPMARLALTILDSAEHVDVSLAFSNQGGFSLIEGSVSGRLELLCQRCLHAVSFEVDSEFRLALVRGDSEARRLPDSVEPLIVASGEELSLSELVEDELLLLLPGVAAHPQGACTIIFNPVAAGPELEEEQTERRTVNPFAALTDLKTNV